jgi:acyl dehydratase
MEFFDRLTTRVGAELGTSDWFSFDQVTIDLYAAVIGDLDPMHNDPDWEAGKREWAGPIVVGTHTLSMLPSFLRQYGFPVAPGFGVRFEAVALPRMRFISPLGVGEKARDRATLVALEPIDSGWQVTTEHRVEHSTPGRPVLVAEFVSRFTEQAS